MTCVQEDDSSISLHEDNKCGICLEQCDKVLRAKMNMGCCGQIVCLPCIVTQSQSTREEQCAFCRGQRVFSPPSVGRRRESSSSEDMVIRLLQDEPEDRFQCNSCEDHVVVDDMLTCDSCDCYCCDSGEPRFPSFTEPRSRGS